MTTPAMRLTTAAALCAGFMLAACSTPPSHLTRIWPQGVQGEPVLGLSTEDGVLVLSDTSYKVGDLFDVQHPVGNSRVDEIGELVRINDNLAVIRPLTARLAEGRMATEPLRLEDQLYVAVRDEDDEPVMEEVERWRGGAHGDLVVAPSDDAYDFARRYAGAGVYVHRHDHWQIVGILSGLVVENSEPLPEDDTPVAVGFIGLAEVARVVAGHENYLDPGHRPMRTDFEFGVERQPGDIDINDWRTMTGKPQVAAKPGPKKKKPELDLGDLFKDLPRTDAGTPSEPATTPTDASTLDFLELLQREAERTKSEGGADATESEGGADATESADDGTDEAPADATDDTSSGDDTDGNSDDGNSDDGDA